MRPDMKKVIRERPRRAGDAYQKPGKPKLQPDTDDQLKSASIRPKFQGWGKEQSLLFNPLKKYLTKQLGRPWNDVWSDICQVNRDFAGQKVREQFDYLVIRPGEEPRYIFDGQFYVDDLGILCQRKEKRVPRRKVRRSKIVRLNGIEYFQHENIWYRVRTSKLPKKIATPMGGMTDDVFGAVPWGVYGAYHLNYRLKEFYGEAVYCVWKQAANSKEIKAIKQHLEKQ